MGSRWGSVVAVKEVASAVPKEEWSEERLLPGDIIERVTWVDGQLGAAAPFVNGKAGLENELRQMFRTNDVQVLVWVRRAGGVLEEVRASVLPEELVIPKKHYTLRSYHDFRHIVYLADTTEDECLRWQEATLKILSNVKRPRKLDIPLAIKKGLIGKARGKMVQGENMLQTYPWVQKMQRHLPMERSSMLFSMLFMPFQPSPERVICKDVEDTTARAMAWFCSAQAAGVPIIFVSIHTEYIFKECTKDVRDFFDATNKESIQQLTSCGRFKFACSDSTMMDVAKAVRLWYVPPAAEVPIDLFLEIGEAKFGLSMKINEEGFCYVVEVDDKSASDRAGVKALLEHATNLNKLLVVSRIGEEKVVPWLTSCDGLIHCYGVPIIHDQLSVLLRQTHRFARIYLMVWESPSEIANVSFMVNDTCKIKTSEPHVATELFGYTPPTSTPSIMKFKSSSTNKRRTVSWSEQLATTNDT